MAGPTITARFLADTTGLTAGVDKATQSTAGKIGDFAKKAAVSIGAAFAVDKVVSFAKETIDAASSMNEAVSKVGVVFGASADDVVKWSENSAKAMGMSQLAALTAAGTYGNLAVALGLPQDQAAGMSKSLVQLAADLGSFNDVPVEDALQALQSGLTGETEPLKRFGVNLNDTSLKAEALSMGLVTASVDSEKLSAAQETAEKAGRKAAQALKEHGQNSVEFRDAQRDAEQAVTKVAGVMGGKMPASLTASQKAQAAYSLIMKQTTVAQGDFERTSGSLANKTKSTAAEFENMKAKIGKELLPVMITISSFIGDTLLPAFQAIGSWIAEHKELMAAAFIGLGTAVAVVVVPAFISWAVAAGAAAIATLAAAAPFIAIGAVIAGVAYLIIHNWDTIKAAAEVAFHAVLDAIMWVWNWVKANWPTLVAILAGPIGIAVLLITQHWDSIKAGASAVWQWIQRVWDGITNAIGSAVGAIGRFIGQIVNYLKMPMAAATEVFNWVSSKFQALVGAIGSVVGGIARVAGSIADAIKRPINAVIGMWNRMEFRIPDFTLPSFDVGPVHLGGQHFGGATIGFPDIPTLAAGGVLTSPTLFVGGEAGTEIVAPEEMLRAIIRDEGGGGHYELNLYPRTADASDIAYGFRRLELLAGVQ